MTARSKPSTLKRGARWLAPALYGALLRGKWQLQYNKFRRLCRQRDRLVRTFVDSNEHLIVQSGPFMGMLYIDEAAGSLFAPKIVGSYESELGEIIETVIEMRPSVIIDVGCAEGYYTVGLSRLLPDAIVYAFDIDPKAQALCMSLARLNSVAERIVIGGLCDHAVLSGLAKDGAFILCDCEGCEATLLDPVAVPQLATMTLLIELHDLIVPDVTESIRQRFQPTHEVMIITTQPRDPSRYPFLNGLSAAVTALAMDEGRGGPMRWAYLTPRANGN